MSKSKSIMTVQALLLAVAVAALWLPEYSKKSVPETHGAISVISDTLYDTISVMHDTQIIVMAPVTGGTFTMGCTGEQSHCDKDERPAHSVTLSSYYIGKYEVTQGLWKAVMGSLPSAFGMYSSDGTGDNYPVYWVRWDDIANDFIPKLNKLTDKTYRLPTEAEWEYAARGGNKSGGYKYSGSNDIDSVAWYVGNRGSRGSADYGTKPVGTKSPNELGIYDMSGNVWEWVNDWFGDYPSTAQTNPKGSDGGSERVRRGGDCCAGPWDCRVSFRISIYPDYRGGLLGFRLASTSP